MYSNVKDSEIVNVSMILYGTSDTNLIQQNMALLVAKALIDTVGPDALMDKSSTAKSCVAFLNKVINKEVSDYDDVALILTDKESLLALNSNDKPSLYVNRPVKDSCRFIFRIQGNGPVKQEMDYSKDHLANYHVSNVDSEKISNMPKINYTDKEDTVNALRDIIIRYVPTPIRNELNNDYAAALYSFKDVYTMLSRQNNVNVNSMLLQLTAGGAGMKAGGEIGMLLGGLASTLLPGGVLITAAVATTGMVAGSVVGMKAGGAAVTGLNSSTVVLTVDEKERIKGMFVLGDSIEYIAETMHISNNLVKVTLRNFGYDIK